MGTILQLGQRYFPWVCILVSLTRLKQKPKPFYHTLAIQYNAVSSFLNYYVLYIDKNILNS